MVEMQVIKNKSWKSIFFDFQKTKTKGGNWNLVLMVLKFTLHCHRCQSSLKRVLTQKTLLPYKVISIPTQYANSLKPQCVSVSTTNVFYLQFLKSCSLNFCACHEKMLGEETNKGNDEKMNVQTYFMFKCVCHLFSFSLRFSNR